VARGLYGRLQLRLSQCDIESRSDGHDVDGDPHGGREAFVPLP
jgi:hypothetical protein